MKLVKSNVGELTQTKTYEGLLQADFRHKVASTEGTITYNGPFIPHEEWHRMMSFFRWTWDTTKSESQARLYVNPKLVTWAPWAYPQQARTGMSAKELDTPDAKTQRAQFADGDGWTYFGTVHHHCDMGAFQSGTDYHDERNQDGLHITVGNMGSDKHTLHARFYLAGDEFEPDMSMFWDIGDGLKTLLPHELWDKVARHQMGQKVEVEFPQQWKENLIEVKSVVTPWQPGMGFGQAGGSGNATGSGNGVPSYQGSGGDHTLGKKPVWKRVADAVEKIERRCVLFSVDQEELDDIMEVFKTDSVAGIILEALYQHEITFDQLWREWDDVGATRGFAKTGAGITAEEQKQLKAPEQEPIGGMSDDEWSQYAQ